MLLVGVGMFAMYYFLTLYMQQVLGFTAMRTGLACLPLSIGMFLSGASSRRAWSAGCRSASSRAPGWR